MKAINNVKQYQVKYPRHTPRISRLRKWYDRSEWRQSPEETYGNVTGALDDTFAAQRNTPTLESTNYRDFTNLMRRASTAGIKKY